MAMEGTTVAGSRGAYLFHTLSASANVADAFIDSRASRCGVTRLLLERFMSGCSIHAVMACPMLRC
jgi:phage-related baseplate assembly protein